MTNYKGKPLDQYSKEELIEIVQALAKAKLEQSLQHMKDLGGLVG
jgi:hypothetical protein